MTEISVSGLVKSFEIGNNILDGITFQVETGERVGLLGRNGAGKSTLFKILTGELDYDEGDVVIAKGRRLGLISQIPVYPVGFTVEDVLNTAFSRHQKLAEEMERLAAQGIYPEGFGKEAYEDMKRWEKTVRPDMLFCGAPHILIPHAPLGQGEPVQERDYRRHLF